MRAVDVHGFGGGFTLGAVQAGWELVAKKSRYVGFGVLNTLANRQLLGDHWESQAEPPDHWTVEDDVQMVFGNPPCSGFSTLSPKKFRGEDSVINECMWELVTYAGRVSPEIVIFESVQQAYTQGRGLMRQLRDKLEEMTGLRYQLYHVLMNNASTGGCSIRKRYFWVASRVEFGVDDVNTRWDFIHDQLVVYDPHTVPSLDDVIRDLEPLSQTMLPQMYPSAIPGVDWDFDVDEFVITKTDVVDASQWCRDHVHDGSGIVDGHDVIRPPMLARIEELAREVDGVSPWRQGERISDVLRRYYEDHGQLPRSWRYVSFKKVDHDGKIVVQPIMKDERLVETDFSMGHNQPIRWRGERPANVVTGGAANAVVHPRQPRTLTHREIARIQGFPDAWQIFPVRHAADLGPGWGKGVPVHAGRWIAHFARLALEGTPGSITGEESGDRETTIDVKNKYRDRLPGSLSERVA